MTTSSRIRATFYGALAGSFLGLFAFVLFGGRFALGAATATPIREGTPRASIDFAGSSGGLYLIVVIIGVLVGLAVAGLTYAAAREREPDTPKFPLRYQLPVAGLLSGIAAYTGIRAGIGGFADIGAGIVVVSVIRFTLIVAVAGAVAGGVTAFVADRLARPDLLGFGGVAWESRSSVMASMMRAVALPTVAVVTAGAFAVGLSRILLDAEGTLAVVLFAIAGTIVLGGAALLAYRPWERGETRPSA